METTPTPDQSHIKPPSGGKVTMIFAGIVLVLAILFVVGLLPHLKQQGNLTVEAAQVRDEVQEATVVTPHFAPSDSLVLPGSIQAIEETTLNARTSGFVRHRYVDIGSRVKAGQLLAEIESPEIDQQVSVARADEAKSYAGTGQARADVANKQATVVQTQAAVAQTQATVAQMQANLGQARAALKRADAKLLQTQAATATAKAKLAQTKQALAGRQADLAQEQSQTTLAERTWRRWQGLAKSGAVSRQEADEKEFAYETHKAAINSAEAAIHSAEADVDAARANVSSSEADGQAAQEDISAAKESVNAAASVVASSKSNVEAAKASVDASKASVDASKANVQAAVAITGSSQATTRRYTVLQGFERIVAPFSGVITSRSIDAGSLVKADDSTNTKGGLFGLARTDVLRIMVNVPQTYAANMQTGQTTRVTIREFPGRVFTGVIARNAGSLDPATRTLLTEIHVNNANGILLPGTYAQVEFGGIQAKPHMRIPANALVIGAEGTRVAIVTKANKVHFQPVVLGADYGQETEVVSGLEGNESLVTNASDDLKEGSSVKPIAAPPIETPGGAPPVHPTMGGAPPPTPGR
ncbi:MAG: family efflux transporter, subunit [Chthonomonadaceae bacterium]|nr:family efflux transporter, subunit [Chthonomonadaceae bacterium]